MPHIRRSPRTIATAIVTAMVVAMAGMWAYLMLTRPPLPQRSAFPSGLPAQLQAWRSDATGLFEDPNGSDVGPVDATTSAYVDQALRAAGRKPTTPSAAAIRAALSATITNPLYADWAVAVITGSTTLTQTPAAYLALRPADTNDSVVYVALLVQTWCTATRDCGKRPDAAPIVAFLRSPAAVAARQSSPYLEAVTQQAADQLGVTIPAVRVSTTLVAISGRAATYDFYGLAWLAHFRNLVVNADQLLNLVRPTLALSPLGNEDQAAMLAQGWVWLGGAASELSSMADALTARIDPSSGLAHTYVQRQGDLDTTFRVALLVGDDLKSIASPATTSTLKQLVSGELPKSPDQVLAYLEAACSLQMLDALDKTTESTAISAGTRTLAGTTMTLATAPGMDTLIQGVTCLGGDVPALTAQPFPATDAASTVAAMVLLDEAHFTSDPNAITSYYAGLLATLRNQLSQPDNQMLAETAARFAAYVSLNNLDDDRPAAQQQLNAMSQCPGLTGVLTDQIGGQAICSLKATELLVQSPVSWDATSKGWRV